MTYVRNVIAIIGVTILSFVNLSTVALAYNMEDVTVIPVNYSIELEDDTLLEDATLVSTDEYIENGRQITVKVYELSDGTIVTDTLSVSAVATYSKNGSDTAVRTRSITNWGTITITASFTWYTEGLFSYVKCKSMSATHNLESGVGIDTWSTSYTADYVSIGKATAQVEYQFYNIQVPVQYTKGTFKITCTDEGTISDND